MTICTQRQELGELGDTDSKQRTSVLRVRRSNEPSSMLRNYFPTFLPDQEFLMRLKQTLRWYVPAPGWLAGKSSTGSACLNEFYKYFLGNNCARCFICFPWLSRNSGLYFKWFVIKKKQNFHKVEHNADFDMFGNSKRLDWCRNGASERGVGWRRRDEDTDSRLSEHNFQCYNRHRLLPPSTLQHFQVQRSETKKKFWWNPKIKTWLVLRH